MVLDFGLRFPLFNFIVLLGLSYGERISYTAYTFSDSKDNSVNTTSFLLMKNIFSNTRVLVDMELDNITAPPLFDAITGASRPAFKRNSAFEKNRGQILLGMEVDAGQNISLSANYYFSRETDYTSDAISAGIKQEFLNKNLAVSIQGQYSFDRVGKIEADSRFLDTIKETTGGTLELSQLLGPRTTLTAGIDFRELKGKLDDPYRLIEASDGNNYEEKHPPWRMRSALYGKFNHFFSAVSAAALLQYRYYWDSWMASRGEAVDEQIKGLTNAASDTKGIRSHTIQVKFSKYILANWMASVDYRYYLQGSPYFMKDFYSGTETYRTQDFKLRAFDSNNFGMAITYFLRGLVTEKSSWVFLENTSISAQYFRYFNSQDFSANILLTELNFDF